MYDIIIVGAGPSGLTSAIYAGRAGFKTVVIEKQAIGGQVNYAYELENYPAMDGISGTELAQKMHSQAEKYGATFIYDEVVSISAEKKEVNTASSGILSAKAIILCMGTKNRNLGIADETKYIGAGVSYCAVCDGGFFKKKKVAVIGGGNTAFKDALYLSRIAEKVYIIHRREGFRAENVMIERAKAEPKIEFVLNSIVSGLNGEGKINNIVVKNKVGEEKAIDISGVFVAVGNLPETELIKGQIATDEQGYIVTNDEMETSVKGIFAAGDIRKKTLRQIVTACADGAIAIEGAEKYCNG
ncbi:MAG: thioredoxin-disulfide reductase [Clostridia bacterium]